jgi:Glycerol-3-phosphate dehydrogenase
MNKKNISVLGGGSWGTVLAYLASLNGNYVSLWMRDKELVETINQSRVNQRYLPSLDLSRK